MSTDNLHGAPAADPNAAPLEQNIKNLECDGVPYRVIKEDKNIIRQVSIKKSLNVNLTQQLAISPSRNAFKR